ncbi:hypothetical protein CLQ_10843 [Clostridium botulinum Af84]|nr:hypothetical protein CBF_2230 [Clostridium botulinum F str. 230613]EKX79836.1 hypothetical protein CFSAN001628_010028 [Clostridium botulinum CFSAN001628]EPS55996.1 hypothetical protein CLQ_10843 [Clostridium botulinum Af84]KKM42529.1 hypothetical protein VT72_02500 [Clostridium botulinum]CBZ04019.1 hypothetical protein H04402_02211 [Clostridium botulinum H04402 065]
MKPRTVPPLGRKFLTEPYLELLSKMSWFMSAFFIFAVLNLDSFYFEIYSF